MKHRERHAFQIFFDIEHFRRGGYAESEENIKALQQELAMFRQSWKRANTTINFGQGGNYVEIAYENIPWCYQVCEAAAEEFQRVVQRNHWWKEVNV